jgi:CRP-like cAMP-binding protein
VISQNVFRELLAQPEACRFLMNRLASRCSDSWIQMEALACNETTERIRIALSWLSTRIGESTPEGIRIGINQTRLAQMIGTSRENLNRKLSSLKKKGILITGCPRGKKSSFLIRNPEFLSAAGDCDYAAHTALRE